MNSRILESLKATCIDSFIMDLEEHDSMFLTLSIIFLSSSKQKTKA